MKGQPEKPRAVLSPRAAHISSAMSMKQEREGGFAIVTAISFLAVTAVFASVAVFLAVSNQRQSANLVNTTQAQYAAEAGVEDTIKTYWFDTFASIKTKERSLVKFRLQLDTLLLASVNVGTKNKKSPDSPPTQLTGSVPTNVGVANYTTTIQRFDINDSFPRRTILRLRSLGKISNTTTRVITQDLIILAPKYNGLEFALLTENANCIFCHASVTSMEDAYRASGTRPKLDRIKVATLNSLEVRETSADTFVGGSIYTRGAFQADNGGAGSPMSLIGTKAAGTDVKTYNVDSVTGQVDSTAGVSLDTTQDCIPVSKCTANKNFYTNYPQGDGPDGKIPDDFPLPVPEKPGSVNREIDPLEWTDAISETALDEGVAASLLGGERQLFAGAYNQAAAKSASLVNGTTGTVGNVVLKGTDADPLNITGTIYIKGDVVISGRVKGDGKIVASGNIYVMGDLEYNCIDTQAVVNCDYGAKDANGELKLPKFGLVAGGNVMTGDFLSPRGAFIKDGAKWVPYLVTGSNGKQVQVAPTTSGGHNSYRASMGTDESYVEPTLVKVGADLKLRLSNGDILPDRNYGTSFVAGEIAVFNRNEWKKYNSAVPAGSYKPRFYKWGNDGVAFTLPLTNSDGTANTEEEPKKYSNVQEIPPNVLAASVVVDAAPASSWIGQTQLKKFWKDNVESPIRAFQNAAVFEAKTTQKKAFQIDSLLYSSNAVFALARASSATQGSVIINGAVVAADTGFLASGKDVNNGTRRDAMNPGLRLHYDKRLQSLLKNQGEAALTRSDYILVPKTAAE